MVLPAAREPDCPEAGLPANPTGRRWLCQRLSASLKERLATRIDARYCIGAASGTVALLLALLALGIGPGDEIVTSPFTFFASSETIALLGATPVFADIDPSTYNLDPAKIEAAITPRTRAVMPITLYGQPPEMDAINAIAARHQLPVIEDAAQSFGALYFGRHSGNLSTRWRQRAA